MRKTRRDRHLFLCLAVSMFVVVCSIFTPVNSVADRSLYLTFDRPLYALGETVRITTQISAEACSKHDHLFDLYIYDSQNLLVTQISGERYLGLGGERIVLRPEDFPVTRTFAPPKADVYAVKLWVTHSPLASGHRQAYLEDTATLRIVPYIVTTQTTTTPRQLTTTTTTVLTAKSTTRTTITTTETETVGIDLTNPLVMASLVVAIAGVIGLSLILLRRKKTVEQPSRTQTKIVSDKKYCVQCGRELSADDKFCLTCGANQDSVR